ncbi:hypothetical protein, partial [uncultured Desulfovibrio sp.]|uniref:hypothetical protein n=1 Tax=uncultured Desulfovibrio sp. TaxID=167968 RepID=UPI00261826C3
HENLFVSWDEITTPFKIKKHAGHPLRRVFINACKRGRRDESSSGQASAQAGTKTRQKANLTFWAKHV